jgi:CRISP-associated protein Cas1
MTEDHDPLIRVMALHALAYCERLFYLEEVEEIRLEDAAVFAGRALHEELAKSESESGEWSSLEMASDSLGLVGKVDCLRRVDGSIIPYEHKRGRPKRVGKAAAAWPSDALQVTAYGMLLEEATLGRVPEGRIRYHAENVTVRVPLDVQARAAVLKAVVRARELRLSQERPPVCVNDRHCIRCSLSPVCLPEEERLAGDPSWEPVRLFPRDHDAKNIHVVDHGSRIGRTGNSLKIESSELVQTSFPKHEVGALILHGYPQISTQALHFCADNGIPVHFISGSGRYVAGLSAGSDSVQRRLRQYRALSDTERCLLMAKKLVAAKVEGALRYILRATRGQDRAPDRVGAAVQTMRSCLREISRVQGTDELRGHEGLSGRAYFSAVPSLLREEVPGDMRFTKRSRRPPKDRFNALLGFGYALLYRTVFQAVAAVGLEPAIGFFHTPRSSAHPLVLDLMELFRVPLWDMVLVGSVNRLQWNVQEDFNVTPGRVWLSESGRKKAIQLFEKRLSESWKHPVVGYSLSYARLVELEVRLLEKEWTGSPGLFGRMRLR